MNDLSVTQTEEVREENDYFWLLALLIALIVAMGLLYKSFTDIGTIGADTFNAGEAIESVESAAAADL